MRTTEATVALALAIIAAAAASAAPVGTDSPEQAAFETGKAGFEIRVHGETNPYRELAVFVLPGERLDLATAGRGGTGITIQAPSGEPARGVLSWRWTAPDEPGLYPVVVTDAATGSKMRLQVFVMVPATSVRDGVLNGYRIGSYPATALRGLDIYRPPKGFVEVTPDNRDIRVSPHFTLGQFLCKQEGDWPKYVVLRERLVLKLETLLEKVNEAGHRCDTFFVMSGYRTPYYNHAIRNVRYSRHLWGGAADIFIDVDPADGVMDDLNHDGRVDVEDARVLHRIVESSTGAPWYEPFVGGLGLYRKTPSHGPFVHVDARGFRARWGD